MEIENLVIERKGHMATIVFDRFEKRNSLSPRMLIGIFLTLRDFAKANDVWVVVFRGAGDKAFSSGYDISVIPTEVTREAQEELRNKNPLELCLDSVKNYPFPTIAMLNGYAFGAGFNLAMCCDIRIAADDVRMGLPPARLGLVYHIEGLKQVMDALGTSRAKEVLMTARNYEGAELKEMGIVDHLVPRAELEPYTYKLAEEIAANAPLSLKGMKRIVNMFSDAVRLAPEQVREAEGFIREAFNSADLKEGQMAFLQKRKPNFTGK